MTDRPHSRQMTLSPAGALAGLVLLLAAGPAAAQQPTAPAWPVEIDLTDPSRIPPPALPGAPSGGMDGATMGPGSTTVVKQKPKEAAAPVADGASQVKLVALLTADGQRIDNDLVWRVFEESSKPGSPGKLIATHREASPVLRLAPGAYIVNAAFGRAHITRRITVAQGVETSEPFVLNAGGLRVQVAADAAVKLDAAKMHYDVMSDERDQSGNRSLVLSGAKPGIVLRLNSGIYHVVSTYGDANATIGSDVTVEAGKLTEMTVAHKPARVTLKLVQRQGGEALPDTEWTLLTPDGRSVKETIGALPTHFLAAGTYMAVAKSHGSVFRREFSVKENEVSQIELIRQ
jgi:hypothetical protein